MACMHGTLDHRIEFLSTARAGRREWRLAAGIILVSVVFFLAVVPYAKVQWPKQPAFIPIYESAVVICDLITAILLFGQFSLVRSKAVLMLASAYLFTSLMAIAHALTFPGLFAERGLLGAGTQSTAWLYMFWHAGFPLLVAVYAVLKRREAGSPAPEVGIRIRPAFVWCLLAALAVVCGLTVLATDGEAALPAIMDGSRYTPAMKFVVGTVWALPLVGLYALWTGRPHSQLDLWLMTVMCAWLFDVALSAVFNAGRFDAGFYVGRAYGFVAASVVLAVMLLESNRLYGVLAGAAAQLRDYAGELELRVRERTAELAASNETLRAEMAERKQAQEQLLRAQKLQAIGQLTGGIAHDFNNMLGVIVGNIELLLAQAEAERGERGDLIRRYGQNALDGAFHGAELTRRLLAFSRKQTLETKVVDLNEVVRKAGPLLSRALGEQIEVRLQPAANLAPCLADASQLDDVLLNLAINARDAMPGGGTLTIETGNAYLDEAYVAREPGVSPGAYAMLVVSDTGCGMPPEVLDHVLEPFFTTKDPDKGTGLGLSMAYGFVKQSGGHIKIYSEVGRGTAVRIYLPVMDGAAEDKAAEAETAAAPRGSELILVVEDNAALRAATLNQLQGLGYRTVEAENGLAALSRLGEHPGIVLMFSDVVMPGGMTGYDLAREARRRRPDLKILLASGFTARAGVTPAVEMQGLDLLQKPFRLHELATRLRHLLDAK